MQITEQATVAIDEIPDDWESLTEIGREIAGAQDKNRWALGDLVVRVHKVYGGESIKKFATEIRMPAHKTLYDYWRTSAFWPADARAEYPLLSWSHYRAASRAVDLDAALHYLEMANDEDMPVAAMVTAMKADMGNPVTQRKTFEARHTGAGHVLVEDNIDFCPLTYAHPDAVITVTVTWTATPGPG